MTSTQSVSLLAKVGFATADEVRSTCAKFTRTDPIAGAFRSAAQRLRSKQHRIRSMSHAIFHNPGAAPRSTDSEAAALRASILQS
jgi:hypothetical protein